MLTYLLYALYLLACVTMIIAVLLQPGKADAGALFTSASSTAFGPRGTQTLLAKITIGAAALFMLMALTLSLPALTGPRSVLQSQPALSPQASPAATPQQGSASPIAPQQNGGAAAGGDAGQAPVNSDAAPAASPAVVSPVAPAAAPTVMGTPAGQAPTPQP